MPQVSEESRAKFASDGSPLRYTGVTVVCHLQLDESPDAIYGAVIKQCYGIIQKGILDHYVQLPKDSLHMTILDTKVYRGTRDDNKEEHRDRDMARYRSAFTSLHMDLQKCIPIKMAIDVNTSRYPKPGRTLKVPLKPFDENERNKLRRIRELLCSAFGKAPPDDAYPFHITGYYALQALSEDEFREVREAWAKATRCIAESVPTFEIDRIELCDFENMFHFNILDSVSAA